MNNLSKASLLCLLCCWFVPETLAQSVDICRSSPEGVYLLLNDGGASRQQPYKGIRGYVISRADGERGAFREIARVERAPDLAAFRKLAGDDLVDQIKRLNSLPTDEDVWRYIVEHPRLEDYGFLVLDLRLARALGAYYLDEEVKGASAGTRYRYRVQMLPADGQAPPLLTAEVRVGRPVSAAVPRVSQLLERDTLVAATWQAPAPAETEVFFARIYRQIGGRGPFELLPDRILVSREGDSLIYHLQEQVRPEVLYRYCIQPTDLFGNPGPLSDTVALVSVDFEAIPLLQEVNARDTTGGILLHWQPLAEKAYWTGLMVERSRDSRGNYVVLDTLPATDSRYFDRRALPNTVYYYRLKAVTFRLDQTPPSAAVSAAWRNELLPPSPPANLRGYPEGPNVRLVWEPSPEPDLYAYYVYRGRSRQDTMVVISPPLQEPVFLDTSRTLNGRSDYYYAVRAVNLSERESTFSNRVAVRPEQFVPPPAPPGLSGYGEGFRIRLSWPDAAQLEETVIGYQVYRRKAPPENSPKEPVNFDSLPASRAAERFGFALVANVPAPYFDDTGVQSGQSYQYAVASIDAVGSESTLSSVATISLTRNAPLPPPEINVRSTAAGVEINWGASGQAGVAGYAVYRRTRTEVQPERIARIPAGQSGYTDAGAPAGTFYFYSVSTLTESGESRRSGEKGIRR